MAHDTQTENLPGLGAAAGLAVIFVGVIAVVPLTMDWDRFRGQIGSHASSRLGRTVEVRGHLQVVPSWRPQVRAEQFAIAKAKGGSGPEMFRADDVYFQFRICSLLIGRLEIDAVRLAKVTVLDAIAKVVLKTLVAPAMPFVSPPEEEAAREQRPCDKLIKQAEAADARKPGATTGATIKPAQPQPAK